MILKNYISAEEAKAFYGIDVEPGTFLPISATVIRFREKGDPVKSNED